MGTCYQHDDFEKAVLVRPKQTIREKASCIVCFVAAQFNQFNLEENEMVRTRYAPSPTGYMHVGNLRTALYEYLTAKREGGVFIIRIEDTDQERYVDGAVEVIFNTLRSVGIVHDEGPDVGGDYGPYVQSERRGSYLKFAEELVAKKKAYYCFCKKERDEAKESEEISKYDRTCLRLSEDEVKHRLENGEPYVIRQLIPEGSTSFDDLVYGRITIDNQEMEDQILIKSDGMPTYNFANVIDDHLMNITHVVRGCEYLTSTPKYNLLYEALGWDIPSYIHLPLIVNSSGAKLSKRKGDATYEDLLEKGYLPEAIINFIALLGFSPSENREVYSLAELVEVFDPRRISKSPSVFDLQKLTWMNGEYIKAMPFDKYYEQVKPLLQKTINRPDGIMQKIAGWTQSRVDFIKDAPSLVDFIEELPDYSTELFVHKKMKTTLENSLDSLEKVLPVYESAENWTEEGLHNLTLALVAQLGIKNGQMLWPIRTALSGKPTSPCGATELAEVLGKDESLRRLRVGIEKLKADVNR